MTVKYIWQIEFDSGRTDYGASKRDALAKTRPGENVISIFSEKMHQSTPLKTIVSYRGYIVKRK